MSRTSKSSGLNPSTSAPAASTASLTHSSAASVTAAAQSAPTKPLYSNSRLLTTLYKGCTLPDVGWRLLAGERRTVRVLTSTDNPAHVQVAVSSRRHASAYKLAPWDCERCDHFMG